MRWTTFFILLPISVTFGNNDDNQDSSDSSIASIVLLILLIILVFVLIWLYKEPDGKPSLKCREYKCCQRYRTTKLVDRVNQLKRSTVGKAKKLKDRVLKQMEYRDLPESDSPKGLFTPMKRRKPNNTQVLVEIEEPKTQSVEKLKQPMDSNSNSVDQSVDNRKDKVMSESKSSSDDKKGTKEKKFSFNILEGRTPTASLN